MTQILQPNVVILDVIMAGVTGIEAAIQVRAKLPSCKILLLSGQATVDLLEGERSEIPVRDSRQAGPSRRPAGEAA
jgi:CheY-like chemotaxis protein